jgi:ubiquitin C-terminal hydrolase
MLSGMVNLGQSCYFNATLQCLAACEKVRGLLERSHVDDHTFTANLRNLIMKMSEGNLIIRPTTLFGLLVRDDGNDFQAFQPADAHEFLIFTIDRVVEDLGRPVSIEVQGQAKNDNEANLLASFHAFRTAFKARYSPAVDCFFGLSGADLRSQDTNFKTCIFDTFCTLNLPIPVRDGDVTLYDCLDACMCTEELDGDNRYFDEAAGRLVRAQKTHSLWRLPCVLAIVLNRFGESKNTRMVAAPLSLELDRYVNRHVRCSRYTLRAVCNHIGNHASGHYSACVLDGDVWHEIDDATITAIETSEAVSDDAYILFYALSE